MWTKEILSSINSAVLHTQFKWMTTCNLFIKLETTVSDRDSQKPVSAVIIISNNNIIIINEQIKVILLQELLQENRTLNRYHVQSSWKDALNSSVFICESILLLLSIVMWKVLTACVMCEGHLSFVGSQVSRRAAVPLLWDRRGTCCRPFTASPECHRKCAQVLL